MERSLVVDAHVHFWDPSALRYPWLDDVPALRHAFIPRDYEPLATATVDAVVFVEANCAPSESELEVDFVDLLASADRRIAGTVAFIDLLDELARPAALERLARTPRVVGVRQNIQGHPPGFCLDDRFVRGARAVGRQGLTFDLCATEGQLSEIASLVEQCPDTMFVLDHCGKPAIGRALFEPWAASITRLASHANVWCKLSGLLTEAPADARGFDALQPYAHHVLSAFGVQRLMYGSDWPVVTLAGGLDAWHTFTEHFTRNWQSADRERFYSGSAIQFYDLRLDDHDSQH